MMGLADWLHSPHRFPILAGAIASVINVFLWGLFLRGLKLTLFQPGVDKRETLWGLLLFGPWYPAIALWRLWVELADEFPILRKIVPRIPKSLTGPTTISGLTGILLFTAVSRGVTAFILARMTVAR